MSFVTDHVRRIDSQLDSFQLAHEPSASPSPKSHSPSDIAQDAPSPGQEESDGSDAHRVLHLQTAIKTFSAASSSQAILDPQTVLAILQQAELLSILPDSASTSGSTHISNRESELAWLLISKATTQVYGLVLNLLLDQTIPLGSDIGYWDAVLGSYKYTALYTVQTSPLHLWAWIKVVYRDARSKLQRVRETSSEHSPQPSSYSDRWSQLYGLVKDSVHERSLADVRSKFMSPVTIMQAEVRSNRKRLKRLREMSASGLGILVDEGMMLDNGDEDSVTSKARSDDKEEWKSVVAKSVSLMEFVLQNITVLEMGPGEFEETVFMNIEEENGGTQGGEESHSQPLRIALRLQQLMKVNIPAHLSASQQATSAYGRPSRLVRYWLPATMFFLSSSTLFRIVVNRKAEIATWMQDFGTTTIDFWYNWVVEPLKKVIGTIRHDKGSEIAIMSRESLEGDKASLERMVLEFAADNPDTSDGSKYTEAQTVNLSAKIREGDLTPVLKVYEKDLRRPFIGTIRGDLIRALLIQIQKTKVDVEIALGGIDNLLKSQELVFGFVGITPGVLVCIGVYQWLRGIFAGRRGRVHGRKQGSMIRVLRNIDRILTASTPQSNMLSYKEHGLLLCEAHTLRQRAAKILPGELNNEFLEELHDLSELRTGVERQLRVIERIRWAYAKYLH